ncbi:MAG: hypothetical protein JO025_02010 [Verrucomicrobia bacterium]|nr:hypothetical protein [Verrucomicrobiota bacterium]
MKTDWQLSRRKFRVLRDIPMRPYPAHIATALVRVPESIAEYFHLVNSVAEVAVRQVIASDFPELHHNGYRIQLWTAYFLDLRWLESQNNFGESNHCRVWVTGPNPEHYKPGVIAQRT